MAEIKGKRFGTFASAHKKQRKHLYEAPSVMLYKGVSLFSDPLDVRNNVSAIYVSPLLSANLNKTTAHVCRNFGYIAVVVLNEAESIAVVLFLSDEML